MIPFPKFHHVSTHNLGFVLLSRPEGRLHAFTWGPISIIWDRRSGQAESVPTSEPAELPTQGEPADLDHAPVRMTADGVRGVFQFAEGWLWGAMFEEASEHVQERMDEMVEVYMRDCNG